MLDLDLLKDENATFDEKYLKQLFPKFGDDIIQLLVRLSKEKVVDFTNKKQNCDIPIHISYEPVVLKFD